MFISGIIFSTMSYINVVNELCVFMTTHAYISGHKFHLHIQYQRRNKLKMW
jgi:hypothetical protein